MWYVYDVLYAVLYVRVSCFVVRVCAVSRRYINVYNCDMFSVVDVYLDHLKFCVVCIDGRRYVCCSECNVVSNECNEPTSCLVQPIGTHGGEIMYFGCVCSRGELGFLNCNAIYMCVVNKQFELLEFVFDSVYVDLQYEEISLTFTAGSVSLYCVCGRLLSVCEVVVVPYVDAVVAVTVMRSLLFALHVCLLRECDGVRLTAMLVWRWTRCGDGRGVVSAGHIGGTRGSGIVSSATDLLWMSVVRGMRGVGGVCEMCMCVGSGAAWVERGVSG